MSRHTASRPVSEAGPGSLPSSLCSAAGIHPRHALSPVQEAILQENIHRFDLEELQSQIIEDTNADLECQRLNTQAREAQRLQQEAQEAREAIANCLDRQRRLKKKEKELEVAKLVTSLLQEPGQEGTCNGETTPKSCHSSQAVAAPPPHDSAGTARYSVLPPHSSPLTHHATCELPRKPLGSQPCHTGRSEHIASRTDSSHVGHSLQLPLLEPPPALLLSSATLKLSTHFPSPFSLLWTCLGHLRD